jgi:hypothetical protein
MICHLLGLHLGPRGLRYVAVLAALAAVLPADLELPVVVQFETLQLNHYRTSERQ